MDFIRTPFQVGQACGFQLCELGLCKRHLKPAESVWGTFALKSTMPCRHRGVRKNLFFINPSPLVDLSLIVSSINNSKWAISSNGKNTAMESLWVGDGIDFIFHLL